MKKSWINFICILLCVLIPFAAVAAAGFLLPPQFENTFLGELSPKVERLYSADEPKIIVIGGSSVPFGVDSKLLEKAVGMPVINFGLYATLGTKLMLDLSRKAINNGDIIVIAPETDAQTYSLYFNSEAAWQACDSDHSMLFGMSGDDLPSMLGGFWKYTAQKLKYFFSDSALNPSGVYNRASFDEYGDITYPRPYNVMTGGYDTSSQIKFSPDIISDDFIDYVNDYVKFAESKGATVLFSFAPANEDAIDPETTLETLEGFSAFISDSFDCELISDPNDYLYRSGYFYDSNFHMNDAGMILHTRTLALDLTKALGREMLCDIEIPEVPEKPEDPGDTYDYSYDENEKYFAFTETAAGYILSGTSELGKAQKVLTTPRAYAGKRVFAINANAFDGCSALTDIYVTTGISQINDGAFSGAPALEKVHIVTDDPDNTTVNNVSMGLRNGMAQSAMFFVPSESYSEFTSNYFWGPYADYIRAE